jgi:hypothetical protein
MQPFETWLVTAPVPLIAIVLMAAMLATATIAALARRSLIGRLGELKGGTEGYIISGVLGLLALLTSFTFAIAVDRYETRRHLVLEESNAIGTAYLLVRYTDNRIALAPLKPGDEQDRRLVTNDALVTQIWAATAAATPSIQAYEYSGSLIEAINAVIDLDASRKAARAAHVPPRVFAALILYQLIGAGVLGCVISSRIDWTAASLLFLLFTGVLILMLDLDRPLDGGVRTSQRPMQDLQSFVHSAPFDSAPRPTGGPVS